MPANSPYDDDSEKGLVARESAGDNAKAYSISEISARLKRTVESEFGFVRLQGELSGVKRAASGHLYCALKDEKAVIDGVMWKGNTARLPFAPEDGLEVVASGKLTTYASRSKYQLVIERMELAGEGALLALLEKTKARLEAEGLFTPERKRALPYLPRTIGVVTSPTGAVIRDILHRLADRFPRRVIVWPVLVQGQGAAEQVAGAVRGFSDLPEGHANRPDLVIVARGGGSIEDLWGFNEEAVVRAIADCTIPTISAVGHETDTTLADFAADRRAPTPTAAAEMAVPVRAELAATLGDFSARGRSAILRPVALGRERLTARAERMPKPETLLQPQAQRLDDTAERLRRGLMDRAGKGREALGRLRLSTAMLQRSLRDGRQALAAQRLEPEIIQRKITDRREKLAGLARLAEQLHPDRPLARGYVRVLSAAGATLTDKAQADKEAALTLKFRDGDLNVATDETPQTAPKNPPPKPKKRRIQQSDTGGVQDDLFG